MSSSDYFSFTRVYKNIIHLNLEIIIEYNSIDVDN